MGSEDRKIPGLGLVTTPSAVDLFAGVQDGENFRWQTNQILRSPVDILNAKHFGAVGNGSIDDTDAIQDTLNAASGNENFVFIPAGTYVASSPIVIPDGVGIYGAGPINTIFRYDGNTEACFINNTSTGAYENGVIRDIGLDLASNANAVSGLDFKRGLNASFIENIRITLNAASVAGILIRGVDPDTGLANNKQYSNNLVNCIVNGGEIGFWLFGQDIAQARSNANRLWGCKANTQSVAGVRVNGDGNLFSVIFNGTTGDAFLFEGDIGIANIIMASYFDSSIVGADVHLANPAGTQNIFTIIGSIGFSVTAVTDDNPNADGSFRYNAFNFSIMYQHAVDLFGRINHRWVMGNSTKDPRVDAPVDWIEQRIDGIKRFIPVYAA